MGYSAGAGTTDGQFLPFLHQGMTKSKWWIDAIANVLARPTKEDVQCHFPKPILLASGHVRCSKTLSSSSYSSRISFYKKQT